jgi:hypothetical protein
MSEGDQGEQYRKSYNTYDGVQIFHVQIQRQIQCTGCVDFPTTYAKTQCRNPQKLLTVSGLYATDEFRQKAFSKRFSDGRSECARTFWVASYSRLKVQNVLKKAKKMKGSSSHVCMKKLILVGAILVGVAATSQAGVSVRLGFGLPFGSGRVVVNPAPVYCAPPVVVAPPVCEPRVVYQPVCPPPRVVYCPPRVRYYAPDCRYDRGHWHGRGHDNRRW